jgi:hypothetical protein
MVFARRRGLRVDAAVRSGGELRSATTGEHCKKSAYTYGAWIKTQTLHRVLLTASRVELATFAAARPTST